MGALLRAETAAAYRASKKYHNNEHGASSVHLQHISGNKFILHKLTELPLIVAIASGHAQSSRGVHAGESGLVSPRVFVSLVEELRKHKQAKQYQDESKPKKQNE